MKFDLIKGLHQVRSIVAHSVELSAVTQGFNIKMRLTCTLEGNVQFANQTIILGKDILEDNLTNSLNDCFTNMCYSLKNEVDSYNKNN